MNEAKIQLSPKELELITNADWILTKNGIIQKVKELLETLLNRQQAIVNSMASRLPAEVISVGPKISKGENYLGLPYLVLDYPRYFDKEHVFAIRTMFWWGHFFSSTLHLAGKYKQTLAPRLLTKHSVLTDSFICIGQDEWQHHFEKENYQSLSKMDEASFKRQVGEKKFLKLAYRVPLQQWDNTIPLLEEHFNNWLKLLAD